MVDDRSGFKDNWALILGASSGFGEACAISLAEAGCNIIGVHLDRKGTQPHVEEVIAKIKSFGRQALFFNVNAADEAKRASVLNEVEKHIAAQKKPGYIKVVLHSLAFGTLKPYVSKSGGETITKAAMDMTLDVMAHSLVYWVQDVYKRKLLKKGSRLYGMTSSGGSKIWATYGAVSAAKAAMESHLRQFAFELGKEGITANAIMAGVTHTPALEKIPGFKDMIYEADRRNPSGRKTTVQDVADAIVALADDRTHWLNGNILGVDGGEYIVQ